MARKAFIETVGAMTRKSAIRRARRLAKSKREVLEIRSVKVHEKHGVGWYQVRGFTHKRSKK